MRAIKKLEHASSIIANYSIVTPLINDVSLRITFATSGNRNYITGSSDESRYSFAKCLIEALAVDSLLNQGSDSFHGVSLRELRVNGTERGCDSVYIIGMSLQEVLDVGDPGINSTKEVRELSS